jgi:hypothetical protein
MIIMMMPPLAMTTTSSRAIASRIVAVLSSTGLMPGDDGGQAPDSIK